MAKSDDIQFVALSEKDVDDTISRMAKLNSQQITKICDEYVKCIKNLITTVQKSMDEEKDEEDMVELDRMARIVGLSSADDIFIRSKDKIWLARDHILNKNAKWFIDKDYSQAIKKDHKQRMIETIVSIVKTKYMSLSQEEQDKYWNIAQRLLRIIASFKKLSGEK